MDENEFYEQIKNSLDEIPENFNILEEQIDIATQTRYFNFSKKLKATDDLKKYIDQKDLLFVDIEIDKKREILSRLALISDVTAYRAIEKYLKAPDKELKEWAILALQENRMLLQSQLLGEQQIYISTGLGGKGKNLRYFVVFAFNDLTLELAEFQEKLLKNELSDLLTAESGELEEIKYYTGYITSQINLPLKAQLKEIFNKYNSIINEFGNFLSDNVIVTNVKKLSEADIKRIIEKKREEDG